MYDLNHKGTNSGLAGSRVLIQADLYPTYWADLTLAYILYPEIRPSFHQEPEELLFNGEAEYRFADLDRCLLPTSSQCGNIGLYLRLYRVSFTVHLPFADLSAGSQAVYWASARVINPTDVFVSNPFTFLETEFRPGIDAFRIRVPFGSMNEVDAGYIAGEDFQFDKSALYCRTRLSVLDTDLSFPVILFRENLLLGLDAAGSLGSAGVWAETAWVVPDIAAPSGGDSDRAYLNASAGTDYNFSNGLYGYVEYHFNSQGGRDPSRFLDIQTHTSYQEGGVHLLGRRYLSSGGCSGWAIVRKYPWEH